MHGSTFLTLLCVLQLWLVCVASPMQATIYKPGISQSKCQSLVVPFIGNWLLVANLVVCCLYIGSIILIILYMYFLYISILLRSLLIFLADLVWC